MAYTQGEALRRRSYPHFTPEHELFRKSVRQWCERELAPHAAEWEAARLFPNQVFRRAGELGFLGIRVPEQWQP
jgi:alkylation response protein AidB-like acyl-CoA dehydrogenase